MDKSDGRSKVEEEAEIEEERGNGKEGGGGRRVGDGRRGQGREMKLRLETAGKSCNKLRGWEI